MISVPADLVKVNMGNKRKWQGPNTSSTQSSTGQSIGLTVLGVVASFIVIFGFMWSPIKSIWDEHVAEFREVKAEASGNGKTLARVEAKLEMLEKLSSGVYRSQAKAAGLEEVGLQVIPAKLNTNATYEASIPKAKPGSSVKIKNLRYNRNTETLSFMLDASYPGLIAENNFIMTVVKIGQTVNLTDALGRQAPPLFLRLLEVPTPDQAILAIGQERDQADKQPS